MKTVENGIVWKSLTTFVITMTSLIILFLLTWLIPDRMVKYNVDYSLDFVGEEWPPIFTHADASRLDDYTDSNILSNCIKERGNSEYGLFKSMLDINGYPRYWHGYLTVLRPMLALFNYLQIRYISMFLFMILIAGVFTKMKERLGWGIAISFILGLCMTYIIIIPWSLQFSPVYYIMLIYTLLVLLRYSSEKANKNFWLLSFMVIGVITNFIDFLTAPLLTLGIPLSIITLFDLQCKKRKDVIVNQFFYMVFWGIGYAFSWITKWLLASLVLQKNVLSDAYEQAKFRTTGGEETILDSIVRNLEVLKMPYFHDTFSKWYGATLGILALLIIVAIVIFFHKKDMKFAYPLILPAILPYAWMCVFKEHSYIHFAFVYRIQMITIFCLMCIYVGCIDWTRLASVLSRLLLKQKHE